MDRRGFYQAALDNVGAGDTVIAACVEGVDKGGKALYQKDVLQAAMPEEYPDMKDVTLLPASPAHADPAAD